MSGTNPILNSLASRKSRWGIGRASSYLKSFSGCWSDGFCPTHLLGKSNEEWQSALKEAEQKLVYADEQLTVKAFSESDLPEGSCLGFRCVITSTRKDRDRDVLESSGATVDPKHALLSQHNPLVPIGKFLQVPTKTKGRIEGDFAIIDLPIGRDHAAFVKFGALRISHGFDPLKYEPLDDGDDMSGWLIKEFEILETSLVSIPSNIDAVILESFEKQFAKELDGIRTVFSRNMLETDVMREWAKAHFDSRPVQGKGFSPFTQEELETAKSGSACGCSGKTPAKDWQKDFDVERQHVEAAKLEYDWVSRFCSCEVKQLVNFDTFAANIRMGSFLTGLKYALADSDQVDARRLTSNGTETPLEYELVQLNSKSSDQFLVDGISFRAHKSGVKFAVRFVRGWSGISVEVMSSQKDKDAVSSILRDAWIWANENNFLKGEAFSIGGEFLPKTEEKWGDLFLLEKNEREVQRTVTLLNEKGKSCPNRGQVFMGPPGTGKTLSGRLIRNNCDATFIWVGGKDAYYYGGIGSVVTAFDLAKELAPAVVFMEDIDAALDSRWAVDVLKTEMDGIGRKSGVVTILTTNHPAAFPEALLDRPGRFHDVLKFDLPTESIRKQMLAKWLPDMSQESCGDIAKKTDGYSGAHVYELCQYAKTLQDQDSLNADDSIKQALTKINDQRELINEELMGDRVQASRRRGIAAPICKSVVSEKRMSSDGRLIVIDTKTAEVVGEKEDDMDMKCPKCGYKGPHSAFAMSDDDEDDKATETTAGPRSLDEMTLEELLTN